MNEPTLCIWFKCKDRVWLSCSLQHVLNKSGKLLLAGFSLASPFSVLSSAPPPCCKPGQRPHCLATSYNRSALSLYQNSGTNGRKVLGPLQFLRPEGVLLNSFLFVCFFCCFNLYFLLFESVLHSSWVHIIKYTFCSCLDCPRRGEWWLGAVRSNCRRTCPSLSICVGRVWLPG